MHEFSNIDVLTARHWAFMLLFHAVARISEVIRTRTRTECGDFAAFWGAFGILVLGGSLALGVEYRCLEEYDGLSNDIFGV